MSIRIIQRSLWSGCLAALTVLILGGCASNPVERSGQVQTGESMVLAGETPAQLAFVPLLDRPFTLRSTYREGLTQTIQYEQGRDYLVDTQGKVRRTLTSRIPDFSTNMLFGKEDFHHDQFPGFGNSKFFVFADYEHREKWIIPPAPKEFGKARLPETRKKLKEGKPLRIVAFGDSITAGGDASEPGLIFWMRYAESLRQKYPGCAIEAINGATGGDTTGQGLQRLQEKVLNQKPDLVLIGFGMNDHNREGFGVPLPQFGKNLATLIDRIRATGAEVILFSAFPPNTKWHYGSHQMEAYAAATERVAREKQCAYADVYHAWMNIADRKKPEDLLANNINHPNDFGHYIYCRALLSIGL